MTLSELIDELTEAESKFGDKEVSLITSMGEGGLVVEGQRVTEWITISAIS